MSVIAAKLFQITHNVGFTCKCEGLNKYETSTKAFSANKVSARGSTDKIFLPLTSKVDTKSPVQYKKQSD